MPQNFTVETPCIFSFSFDEYEGCASFTGFSSTVNKIFPEEVTYNNHDSIETPEKVKIPSYVIHNGREYCVVKISEGAFSNCQNLFEIFIPETINVIEWNMLYCDNLKSITVSDNNKIYKDFDGVLYTKDGKNIIAYPNGHGEHYTIRDGTLRITHFAFKGCNKLKKVVLPDSIIEIGNNAFYRCTSLAQVQIPDKVKPKDIGKYIDKYVHSQPMIIYRGREFLSINDIPQGTGINFKNLFSFLDFKKTELKINKETYFVYRNFDTGEEVLFDKNLNILISKQKQHFESVNERTFIVRRNGKCGLISIETYEIVIPFEYDEIIASQNGQFYEISKDDLSGVCDYNGNILIPLVIDRYKYYLDLNTYSEGLIAATSDIQSFTSKFGFIDKSGKMVIPEEYHEIRMPFKNGQARVVAGRKIVTINKFGYCLRSEDSGFWDFNDRYHGL